MTLIPSKSSSNPASTRYIPSGGREHPGGSRRDRRLLDVQGRKADRSDESSPYGWDEVADWYITMNRMIKQDHFMAGDGCLVCSVKPYYRFVRTNPLSPPGRREASGGYPGEGESGESMICPDCAKAADESRPELHCDVDTCACQHRTGNWVNREVIRLKLHALSHAMRKDTSRGLPLRTVWTTLTGPLISCPVAT